MVKNCKKIIEIVKICQNVIQVVFPRHSDQMSQVNKSQGPHFVFQNQKVAQWVTQWAVCGQLKRKREEKQKKI